MNPRLLRRRLTRRLASAGDERGAVLAIVGITLLVLITSAAIAVDLSALERRGQTLQNSADAAALAGVVTWSSTGDQAAATQVVADVLIQNGVTVDADMALNVSFPNADEVTVELTDGAPEVFFASALGLANDLQRDATARLRLCDDACNQVFDVPAPFDPVLSGLGGDGFEPTVVGEKIYAVNHHGSTMSCVDRRLGVPCWSERQLYDLPFVTMNTPNPWLDNDRIYYLGWAGPGYAAPTGDGSLVLTCWDTTTDTRCATEATMPNVGHGTMVGTDVGIFVFAANRDVYCFVPPALTECGGYEGGRNTALTLEPGWGTWMENSAWNSDILVDGDDIYVTLSNDGEVWVHCWNLLTASPCSLFTPTLLNDSLAPSTDDASSGRLFLHRDGAGVPDALCSLGAVLRVHCLDLDTAARDISSEANLSTTVEAMALARGQFIGVTTYQPATNRVFLLSSFGFSTTYCYDFSTGSGCGSIFTTSAFGDTDTYAYYPEGECLVGYGDAGVFFSLDAELTGPCTTATTSVRLDPCLCTGGDIWPPLTAINLAGVETFEMRLLDPFGIPILPVDGTWMTMDEDVPFDLDALPDVPYVTIELRVEPTNGMDPWADAAWPSLAAGLSSDDPRLVE